MPNIQDNIRQNAFKYVEQGKAEELFELIALNPDLVNIRSQRDGSTLFIRACEHLQKDIIKLLLNEGADPTAKNNHENNGIMYLFYRHKPKISDLNTHDDVVIEILKLLKEQNIAINCFIAQDADKDTPLNEAVRAKLPKSTEFLIKFLEEKNLLAIQLLHKNSNNENTLQIALKNKFFDSGLVKKSLALITPKDALEILVENAITVSSPTSEEKKELLSLIKEHLPKLSPVEIKNLADAVFQKNLYDENCGSDTTFHGKNLQNEYASGNFGAKIFNSIDVELIELLYVAGGINLNEYKNFVSSLSSLEDSKLNTVRMCSAVTLESNKQKMLKVINGSNTLSILAKNPKELNCEENDVVAIKDLALKRICFLIATQENIEISKESEVGILLNFANWANISIGYDFEDNFKKYLLAECENYESLKKVLNIHKAAIDAIIMDTIIIRDKDNNKFEENTTILANEIEKLLEPDVKKVLPKNIFLNHISSKKEETITEKDQELIYKNSKFFTPAPTTFQIPEYDKLEEKEKELLKNSIAYYKNNPENLIPNLVLLNTANDEAKLSKIKDILNNHYIKAKSTVGACFNAILTGKKYFESLEIAGLDASLDKQNLVDKLPLLKDKITENLNTSEVESVKNTTLLCKEVDKFLNISPIASLFEEYNNNYQTLKSDVNKAEEILGEIGIEWSFS